MAKVPEVNVKKDQISIGPKGEVVIKNDDLRKRIEKVIADQALGIHHVVALDNCDCHC